MVNLQDFDRTVKAFMKDFGGPATLSIIGDYVYDPSVGDAVAPKTDYTVKAIILDLTLRSNGLTVADGKVIQSVDKQCLIQPLNKATPPVAMPNINPAKDKFTMGGTTYQILSVKQIKPDAQNLVLYELYLRE